jgi:hypothetical protein
MLAEPRIRAGLDLDGTVFGAVVAKGLGRPFMLIVGDHGGLTPDQGQFFRRLRSTRYALSLRGARHYSFTDLPLFAGALPGLDQAFDIGTIDPLRAHATIGDYVATFFDSTLRNRHATLLDGPSPAHPEITILTAGSPQACPYIAASRHPQTSRRSAPCRELASRPSSRSLARSSPSPSPEAPLRAGSSGGLRAA